MQTEISRVANPGDKRLTGEAADSDELDRWFRINTRKTEDSDDLDKHIDRFYVQVDVFVNLRYIWFCLIYVVFSTIKCVFY